ncbi:MAG TPA: hypothetical protein DEA99_01875, partial [Candidatus Omnitrophica bacterium]|nr:hypothetical protein [Candidatus Omnitrophota bacterium]
YFAAPHTYSFEAAAKLFQIAYTGVRTAREFADTYCGALGKKKTIIIEVEADRDKNYKAVQSLQGAIRDCVSGRLKK